MTNTDTETLAGLLEQSGVGWLLAESRDIRLEQIGREIDETAQEIARRLPLPGLDLLAEIRADPRGLEPLIQLFASPTSTEMRAMVYCVLRGMEISAIEFAYQIKSTVSLRVELEHNVTGEKLTFCSAVVWDAEILRHIGIMTIGKQPLLHGFYAFR
jgi:hypothetical protein